MGLGWGLFLLVARTQRSKSAASRGPLYFAWGCFRDFLSSEQIDRTKTHLALAVSFQEVVHSARTGNSEVAKHQRFAENRMDTHKNAPLTPKGREAMVRSVTENGLSKAAAARQFNTTPKTVAKWVERFRAEGVDDLRDRSSRPLSLPSQTAPATCAAVEALRR